MAVRVAILSARFSVVRVSLNSFLKSSQVALFFLKSSAKREGGLDFFLDGGSRRYPFRWSLGRACPATKLASGLAYKRVSARARSTHRAYVSRVTRKMVNERRGEGTMFLHRAVTHATAFRRTSRDAENVPILVRLSTSL